MFFKIVKKIDSSYDKYVLITSTAKKINFPEYISKENKKFIEELIKENKFSAKVGEFLNATFKVSFKNKTKKIEKIINFSLMGMGEIDKINSKTIRQNLYSGLKNLTGKVVINFENEKLDNIDALAEVVEHINYKFDKYLTKKNEAKKLFISCLSSKKVPRIIEGYELAKISNIVKDLVNEHSEAMNPKALAKRAEELGKEFGFEVEILDEKKAEKLGMKCFLSVARAAHHRPYVIVMRYTGNKSAKYKYGLVGKGLTYDTGGLSLKPNSGMLAMKEDMAGSATMIGAMCAIAKMKVKKNVTAVVATCENSIGPNAYRPGDVVETMNGITVEVTNTDAEGRLTLADALTYIIRKEKVDEVMDAATLTGAIMIALGEDVTGVFTNDDKAAKKLISASENWNEYFWQMPTFDSFKRYLKSDIADMQNTGSRMGGSVNAAKFLEEFVEGKKWIHLDIAGTAFSNGGNPYFNKKGATGQVFRTIYSYIKD
ncbi:MAG: leucyl aminopeptidase [Fusobacteriales bacterium]|nr:MAG: leucyl aminopeptidase [Fusobacteriales bacterium]